MLSTVKKGLSAPVATAALVLACLPATAQANPEVHAVGTTGGVSNVTATSAELLGTVTTNGFKTHFVFVYGTSQRAVELKLNGEFHETTIGFLPSSTGAEAVPVGKIVEHLDPTKRYYFKIYVSAEWDPFGHPNEYKPVDESAQVHTFVLKGQQLHFVTPHTVYAPFGSSPTLRGTLAGVGGANMGIEVLAAPYPYGGGFSPVATGETDPSGHFAFHLPKLTKNTEYRVVTTSLPRPLQSGITTVYAKLHVGFHTVRKAHAVERMFGSVSPALGGVEIIIQAAHRVKSGPRRGTLKWKPIYVTTTNSAGRFSITRQIENSARYRAFARIGGAYSSGASSWAELHAAPKVKRARHHAARHHAAHRHHHTKRHHKKH